MNDIWDVIVIGAGMSGLGAGIRLALGNKRVLIVEQHNSIGGLNSFYLKNKIKYDVGLHALTNFVPQGSKGHPLNKLCRQLRIPYEALQLEEQLKSSILFPGTELVFTNDFQVLLQQIRDIFPQEIDHFYQLDTFVESFSDTELTGPQFISAREQLNRYIHEPLLKEMLLLPLFYYGSSHINDLDWRQFVILYKAIYKEGFSRPHGGVRTILKLLRDRYRELGGKLKVKTEVVALKENSECVEVVLKSGETLRTNCVLSSAGYLETKILLGTQPTQTSDVLTFAETITTLAEGPKTLGIDTTITFFNDTDTTHYQPTESLLDLSSGVICIPENYGTPSNLQTTLRTTHLASYQAWRQLPTETYYQQKNNCLSLSRTQALKRLSVRKTPTIVDQDMFTPLTIQRYTKHLKGAIYGIPTKYRDGNIGHKRIFICGTDQGFLGIIGALLSGISMANYHCLKMS